MGILANGINLPLVAAVGLAVFIPLTLFVVLVECLVLRWWLSVPVRRSFRRVLAANVLSTVAGWALYANQGILLRALGLRRMDDFAKYYAWGALGLIAMYYAKSVAVEGLVLARRHFFGPLGLTRGRLWAGAVAANAASYLVVGPLFYFATRPTFGDVRMLSDPAVVAACQDRVFYTDKENRLCVINADGTGYRAVSTQPIHKFWLCADRKTVAGLNKDGSLWARDLPEGDILALPGNSECGIEFSAGGRQVALCLRKEFIVSGEADVHVNDYGQWQNRGELERWTVGVFDLDRRTTIGQTIVEGHSVAAPYFCWDAEARDILWCAYNRKPVAYRVGPNGLSVEKGRAPMGEMVRNFHGEDHLRYHAELVDTQGDLKLFIWPHFAPRMRIARGDETVMSFRGNRGVLGLGWGGPRNGAFLTAPGRIVFQAEAHVWAGDVTTKSIAPLVAGTYHRLVPNHDFELERDWMERGEGSPVASK